MVVLSGVSRGAASSFKCMDLCVICSCNLFDHLQKWRQEKNIEEKVSQWPDLIIRFLKIKLVPQTVNDIWLILRLKYEWTLIGYIIISHIRSRDSEPSALINFDCDCGLELRD